MWMGVDMVAALSGFSALQQVNTPNLTVAYVILKPFDERRRSAAEINTELNAKFANIKEWLHLCVDAATHSGSRQRLGLFALSGRSSWARVWRSTECVEHVPERRRANTWDDLSRQFLPGQHPTTRSQGGSGKG